MYCKELTFGSMIESPDYGKSDWDKRTVQYLVENYSKVRRKVKLMGRGLMDYQIDDIMSELAVYFKRADDYDIERAYNPMVDTYLSLEGYVSVGIKHCIQRHRTEKYKHDVKMANNVIRYEDGERSIFDTIPDEVSLEDLDNLCYDLRVILKSIRCMRYYYGMDIYMLIYIRELTDRNPTMYFNILEALGVTKKDLSDTEKRLTNSDIKGLIRALSLHDKDDLLCALEPYVYGCECIKKAVVGLLNEG